MANLLFERIEKKYKITKEQKSALLEQINEKVKEELYFSERVCSIYYDNDNFDLITRSIEKPIYKEKLRERSYFTPSLDTTVFLEMKKKYNGVVYKRRVYKSLKEINDFISGNIQPQTQIEREIHYMMKFYGLKRKIYISYQRDSYIGANNMDCGLRITFDSDIRYRDYDVALDKGDYGELLLPEEIYLMEVKAPGAIPIWLTEKLTSLKIYTSSFSKIGTAYSLIKNKKLTEDKNVW